MIQGIQKKAVMDMTKKKIPDTKGGDVTDISSFITGFIISGSRFIMTSVQRTGHVTIS